ncbi:hypothetical protein ACFX1W_040754 [Malus domestica]
MSRKLSRVLLPVTTMSSLFPSWIYFSGFLMALRNVAYRAFPNSESCSWCTWPPSPSPELAPTQPGVSALPSSTTSSMPGMTTTLISGNQLPDMVTNETGELRLNGPTIMK